MKNFAIYFLALIVISCTSATQFYNEPNNDIRYFQTTISNVDRNIITTATGDIWEINGVLKGKQLSNILLVFNLFEDYEGKAFINGTVYNIQSMAYNLNPDGSERNTFENLNMKYKNGLTTNFKPSSDNSIVELSNGSKYQISFVGLSKFKNWNPQDILILSEDEDMLIHPVRVENIRIKKLKD